MPATRDRSCVVALHSIALFPAPARFTTTMPSACRPTDHALQFLLFSRPVFPQWLRLNQHRHQQSNRGRGRSTSRDLIQVSRVAVREANPACKSSGDEAERVGEQGLPHREDRSMLLEYPRSALAGAARGGHVQVPG